MNVRSLVFSAMVAALYVALTMVVGQVGFSVIQFRPSEALTLLPFLFPQATWGLFIGCIIANTASAFGWLDIVFGSLATLLAAYLTSKCKNRFVAAIPPVVINSVVVGGLIVIGTPGAGWISWPANALSIAICEGLTCFLLGIPLLYVLEKLKFKQEFKLG